MTLWWKDVMAMEFRKILAYRSDFWITFLGQMFIQLTVTVSLWQAVYQTNNVQTMQGFAIDQMGLYYLVANIGMRILWGENIGFVSREIYEGTFTRYLLYPLSFFQYKSISSFSYSLFYSVQLCIFYFLYRMIFSHTDLNVVDLVNLFTGLSLFLLSAILFLNLAFMIELLALWVDNVWTLMIMVRFFITFLGGGFIPLRFLPLWALEFLRWTPFPYLIDLPVRTVLGLSTSKEIFEGLFFTFLWIGLLSIIVRFIWSKGEKQYSGVGI